MSFVRFSRWRQLSCDHLHLPSSGKRGFLRRWIAASASGSPRRHYARDVRHQHGLRCSQPPRTVIRQAPDPLQHLSHSPPTTSPHSVSGFLPRSLFRQPFGIQSWLDGAPAPRQASTAPRFALVSQTEIDEVLSKALKHSRPRSAKRRIPNGAGTGFLRAEFAICPNAAAVAAAEAEFTKANLWHLLMPPNR